VAGVEVLLHLDYGQQWTFFGGKIDKSDECDACRTAAREFHEESGWYERAHLQWEGEKEIFWFQSMKYILFCLPSSHLDAADFNAHLTLLRRHGEEKGEGEGGREGEREEERNREGRGRLHGDVARGVQWFRLRDLKGLDNSHRVVKQALSFNGLWKIMTAKEKEK
jgi:8-oxo-dGTP pyrophosphatase MutT (NUDIX family)